MQKNNIIFKTNSFLKIFLIKNKNNVAMIIGSKGAIVYIKDFKFGKKLVMLSKK